MCDFSDECKTKCISCSSTCTNEDCDCDNSEILCQTSCAEVNKCIEKEKKCENLPHICKNDCEMACSVAKDCINSDNCYSLLSDVYKFYFEECLNRNPECAICDDFHMCFQCDEICETSCVFTKDSECDDGGEGSLYNECAEGTDC